MQCNRAVTKYFSTGDGYVYMLGKQQVLWKAKQLLGWWDLVNGASHSADLACISDVNKTKSKTTELETKIKIEMKIL